MFDTWYHLKPQKTKTKREVHLEALLTMTLPYLEREELSTRTNGYLRHLLKEIYEQIDIKPNLTV